MTSPGSETLYRAPILRAPESPPMPLPGLSAFPRTFAFRRRHPKSKIDGDQERTCREGCGEAPTAGVRPPPVCSGARPKSEAYGAPPVKSPMSMMPVAIRAIGSGHGDLPRMVRPALVPIAAMFASVVHATSDQVPTFRASGGLFRNSLIYPASRPAGALARLCQKIGTNPASSRPHTRENLRRRYL